MMPVLICVVLLGVANGTPVLLRLALGPRYARPVDGGLCLRDGYRVFGSSKTLRGIACSIPATAVAAWLLGYPAAMGAGMAAAAMLGDLLSSFIKRRFGFAPSHDVHGLDQIPESLFPALLFRTPCGLTWTGVGGAILAFFILDVVLTKWLRKIESRRHHA